MKLAGEDGAPDGVPRVRRCYCLEKFLSLGRTPQQDDVAHLEGRGSKDERL